ncbi:MAG: VTT domain-containing protein [Bacillota bacterium]|nr:VTT domain-containing protein [Bacillota bacterium]
MILPWVGFAIASGTLSWGYALLAAVSGSLAGGLFIYGLGRLLGRERLLRLILATQRWTGITPKAFLRGETWFQRHGVWGVFLGRLLPGIRSVISLPAGAWHMPLGAFAAATFLGSFFWDGTLLGLGILLGTNWPKVSAYVAYYQEGILLLFLGTILFLFLRRFFPKFLP